MSRALLCAFLSILLCCAPLGVHVAPENQFPSVNVERNEANAIAPVAVAGGAALAAELGISTEAMMAALAAMFAAGTGVYLLNSSDYSTSGVALDDYTWRRLWNGGDLGSGYQENWSDDYAKYKVGSGKSWDELSDEEKAQWSSPAEYVQAQWVGLLGATGMIQESSGGGYEPTPEPEDPEEKRKWQKSRNALLAVAIGSGSVALSDAVGWLGDTVGGGIHDLLFGEDEGTLTSGLGFPLVDDVSVNGLTIPPFVVESVITNKNVDYSTLWAAMRLTDTFKIPTVVTTGVTVPLKFSSSSNSWNARMSDCKEYLKSYSDSVYRLNGSGASNGVSVYMNQPGETYYLNGMYSGGYTFDNQASYNLGKWSGDYDRTVSYPSIADTPTPLKESVADGNQPWLDYIDTTDDSDEVATVVVPSSFDGTTYDDYIGTVPSGEQTPVPDDSAIPAPEPEPEPPYDSTQFQEDYGQAMQKLLQQPFDQLFPFCLIGDLQRYVDIMTSQFVVENQDGTLSMQAEGEPLNGTETLRISLAAFNVYPEDAAEYWEFDLRPLHDLALSVRYMLTGMFVVGLLIGTFSYFLKRGGK